MQFLPGFTALLVALTTAVNATPINASKRACTIVHPFVQVPVDSSASSRVYGNSSANTLWKNPSGNRNMLLSFEIPPGANDCKLKFHAVANPPMSISGSPVSVNAYALGSTVESNTSWNGRPARTGLAGVAGIAVSPVDPTDITVAIQECTSGAMNYELELPETGSLNFDTDANNGFYMTYGC